MEVIVVSMTFSYINKFPIDHVNRHLEVDSHHIILLLPLNSFHVQYVFDNDLPFELSNYVVNLSSANNNEILCGFYLIIERPQILPI